MLNLATSTSLLALQQLLEPVRSLQETLSRILRLVPAMQHKTGALGVP